MFIELDGTAGGERRFLDLKRERELPTPI